MNIPPLTEIMKAVSGQSADGLQNVNIAVLRNITAETLELYAKYFFLSNELKANLKFGEYDNIVQEAIGFKDMFGSFNPAHVLVLMDLRALSPALTNRFPALSPDEIDGQIERVTRQASLVISSIRKQSDATIIFSSFLYPPQNSYQLYDAQNPAGLAAHIEQLNNHLRETLGNTAGAYLLDINRCAAQAGYGNFTDKRFWYSARSPYSKTGQAHIASELFRYIKAVSGMNKKCLVLDCDNTLWGGIIGEDGLGGIKLGNDYPGNCFTGFQQEILNLYHRGIILALCSKNNPEDVMQVFNEHPQMVLREEHFADMQVNWNDKAQNIRQIARNLNIGPDSLVFMDDSEFEINLVREIVPEVQTILLPVKKPYLYPGLLADCDFFDSLKISAEDISRGRMYRENRLRKEYSEETGDIDTYLSSLQMTVEVGLADDFSIPRVAQQTMKTNQFNLTTRRYTESEITGLALSDSSDVLYLKLTDKFGDFGIIGSCILKYEAEEAYIDTFLLSCRALGRGVEQVFLSEVNKYAALKGCKRIRGEYIPTRKNSQTGNFYFSCGYNRMAADNSSDNLLFELDLTDWKEPAFRHFTKITFMA